MYSGKPNQNTGKQENEFAEDKEMIKRFSEMGYNKNDIYNASKASQSDKNNSKGLEFSSDWECLSKEGLLLV